MYWTRKHALICNASHCVQKGSNDVASRLRLEVIRKGLDADVLVNNCGTIDLCDIGPNIVIYPDNVIYCGVQLTDIPEIVEYLRGGPVVERLVLDRNSPEEAARRQFFLAAVAPNASAAVADVIALVNAHGFDDAWVTEQTRRGFMARKPGDTETGEILQVTKKARTRYGV